MRGKLTSWKEEGRRGLIPANEKTKIAELKIAFPLHTLKAHLKREIKPVT
jgi:hypothetical protein